MATRSRVSITTSATKKELYRRQEQQTHYYHRTAGPTLKFLEQGQSVNIYDHHGRTWERGAVIKPAKERRSYIVKNDKTGSIYRRTRTQLRPSYTRNHGINDPSLAKASPPQTIRHTPKQETESQVAK